MGTAVSVASIALGASFVEKHVTLSRSANGPDSSFSLEPNELKKLSDNIPLRRIAEVEEQVGPIVFLCSDLSSYITGAVIDVNGGQI
mgnify:CR=1 FL=1